MIQIVVAKQKSTTLRDPSIVILIVGTALAQAIPAIASPLFSRLYVPEAFGVFAFYTSVLGLLGGVAGGRYEQAIASQSDDKQANALIILVVLVATGVAVLAAPFLYLWAPPSQHLILPLAALAAFLYVVWQSLLYWLVRQGCFGLSTASRIVQSIGFVISAVALAWIVPDRGLILANVCGYFFALLCSFKAALGRGLASANFAALKSVAASYRDFPKYGVIPSLLDNLSMLLPMILVVQNYGNTEAGFFGLSRQVLAAPVAVMAVAVSQMLLKRVADRLHTKLPIAPYLQRLSVFMLILTLPFVAVLVGWGDVLFKWLFGGQWLRAGEYSQMLVLAYAAIVIVSPLSAFLIVLRLVWRNGLWQVIHFLALTSLLIFNFTSTEEMLRCYVAIEITCYIAYWLLIWQGTKRNDKKVEC
jgi:O-antigen/teichoic acid export membrane protein